MKFPRKLKIKVNKQVKDKAPSNYKTKSGIKPKDEDIKEMITSHDLRSRLRQTKLVPQQNNNVNLLKT